jgi:hypothetical protein
MDQPRTACTIVHAVCHFQEVDGETRCFQAVRDDHPDGPVHTGYRIIWWDVEGRLRPGVLYLPGAAVILWCLAEAARQSWLMAEESGAWAYLRGEAGDRPGSIRPSDERHPTMAVNTDARTLSRRVTRGKACVCSGHSR